MPNPPIRSHVIEATFRGLRGFRAVLVAAGFATLALAGPAGARTWVELRGGASLPQGNAGDALNAGWVAGATVLRPMTSDLAAGIDAGWMQFGGSDDATRAESERLSALAGRPIAAHLGERVAPVLFELRWMQPGEHRHALHAFAGLGVYLTRRTLEAATSDVDRTQRRLGVSAGGGWALPSLGGAGFAIETAYHWMGQGESFLDLRGVLRFDVR